MSKKLKKDLQTVKRDIKTLTKSVVRLLKETDNLVKAKIAKKKTVVKKAAKKVAKKARGKAQKASAIDTVFSYIKLSKKGVNTATLMKKSGFDQKKIYNIIFKLKSQKKIKSDKKGVYVKA